MKTVESVETKIEDRESLFNLWENARLEHDAAGHLLLADGHVLSRSVALHLLRGWHALATLLARQSGLPDPEFEELTIERESGLLAPIATRRLASWDESFNAIREGALAPPWRAPSLKADSNFLREQLRLLGRCIEARRLEVTMPAGKGWERFFGIRKVMIAAAVLVLILAAIELGRHVRFDGGEQIHPDLAELGIPDTVKIDLSQVGDFRPRGYAWDGSENVLFVDRLIIRLGNIKHPDIISVSLDGNDRYSLRLMASDEEVAVLETGPSPIEGLEVYTLAVPEEAAERGFDWILIDAIEGDEFRSLGHLLLNEPTHRETP